MLTHYTLSFVSRNPFDAIDISYDRYFHFCYELVLETLAKCFSIKSLRIHDLCPTHSLAGLHSPISDCFSQLKTVCSAKNRAPTKAEEPFLCPFVIKMREMAQPVPTRGFLQGRCHVLGTQCWNPPTSPYPTIFASAKPIFKTDYTNW